MARWSQLYFPSSRLFDTILQVVSQTKVTSYSINIQPKTTYVWFKISYTCLSLSAVCKVSFMLNLANKPIMLNAIYVVSFMLSFANKSVMLSVVMLSVIMLRVIILRVIMLRVIMLSVVMLSVIMLECYAECLYAKCLFILRHLYYYFYYYFSKQLQVPESLEFRRICPNVLNQQWASGKWIAHTQQIMGDLWALLNWGVCPSVTICAVIRAANRKDKTEEGLFLEGKKILF